MKPDVYIKVRFRTNVEGGRKNSLKRKSPLGPDFYACPMVIDGRAYDCRLLIGDKKIELGEYYEIPVKFLEKGLAEAPVGAELVYVCGGQALLFLRNFY